MPEYLLALLYVTIGLGGLGLWCVQPQFSRPTRVLGALIGGAVLLGAWVLEAKLHAGYRIEMDAGALPFYYIFSGLAIGAGVLVIASRKPVHAALWFIMVVLASAGLFLTLTAEFMAFAMVIIYGGAILVTYMFVIMLAAFSGDPQREQDLPLYDRVWRNPAGPIFCGVILLAVLMTVSLEGRQRSERPQLSDATIIETTLMRRSGTRLAESIRPALDPQELGSIDAITGGTHESLTNTERVGLDLFQSHPLGLELAGVILLVALVGAVVIARTHAESPPTPTQTPTQTPTDSIRGLRGTAHG